MFVLVICICCIGWYSTVTPSGGDIYCVHMHTYMHTCTCTQVFIVCMYVCMHGAPWAMAKMVGVVISAREPWQLFESWPVGQPRAGRDYATVFTAVHFTQGFFVTCDIWEVLLLIPLLEFQSGQPLCLHLYAQFFCILIVIGRAQTNQNWVDEQIRKGILNMRLLSSCKHYLFTRLAVPTPCISANNAAIHTSAGRISAV